MKIDHIALFSKNIDTMKDFYIQYFDACANDLYHNEKTGLKTYFLTFSSGARLEIMSKPELKDHADRNNTFGYTHIAFAVVDEGVVDELTARLSVEGVTVISKPRQTGDGYYESIVLDPDGNRVEIVAEKR